VRGHKKHLRSKGLEMSIEAYMMKTLLVENFVGFLEMRIQRSLLIDIVLVMDDVGT